MLPKRTILIKVGSGVLAPDGLLCTRTLEMICDEIATIIDRGERVVLVSSGAVACGRGELDFGDGLLRLDQKRAAAAVGQPLLGHAYHEALRGKDIRTAQVLLTSDDINDRTRFVNARETLAALLGHRVVPIVNENDSVLFDEIRFGDNDALAAMVGSALRVDEAVFLSVAGGLRDLLNRQVITRVDNLNDAAEHVKDTSSTSGTGGMSSKLDAVGVLLSHGIPVTIAPGPTEDAPDPITRALEGLDSGTRFTADDLEVLPAARKSWIAHGAPCSGRVRIDAGAVEALRERGASLLPKGVTHVFGVFAQGEAVDVEDQDGVVIGRGLVNYNVDEARLILGARSNEIEARLGYWYRDELIHRSDLSLIAKVAE